MLSESFVGYAKLVAAAGFEPQRMSLDQIYEHATLIYHKFPRLPFAKVRMAVAQMTNDQRRDLREYVSWHAKRTQHTVRA